MRSNQIAIIIHRGSKNRPLQLLGNYLTVSLSRTPAQMIIMNHKDIQNIKHDENKLNILENGSMVSLLARNSNNLHTLFIFKIHKMLTTVNIGTKVYRVFV